MVNFQISSLILVINPKQVTPLSPIYYLKITREFFAQHFVFGDEDLATWNFNLANKRLTEAEILIKYNLKPLAKKQVDLAHGYQTVGYRHLKPLIDVIDTNLLQQQYAQNQQRIKNLNY